MLMVNWLLTRKCNLNCNLCSIRNNDDVEELGSEDIYKAATNIYHIGQKEYGFDPFFILYGGEPFLRYDIEQILENFQILCKDNFTIYHNATMNDKVMAICKNLKLKRLTTSIDIADYDKSRMFRNQNGIVLLTRAQEEAYVEDAVATITLDYKSDLSKLIPLVEELTKLNITANITTFDPPGGSMYDFSIHTNLRDYVLYSEDVEDIFKELYNRDDLKILRRDILKNLASYLPRNYRCRNPLKSLTIDSTGYIRLCLRIGLVIGHVRDLRNSDDFYNLKHIALSSQSILCNGCVWTCIMMAENQPKD